jgi:enoyl-CoA hydratase/carnithine racemase
MDAVAVEDHESVRHVILHRPERRNAIDEGLLLELHAALRAAAADDAVHCLVLRGAGPAFSTGADLEALALSSGGPGRPFRQLFLDCANACEEMTKPVVCQVHGMCLGGALELALACDLRIASLDARFALPEVRFGVIPDIGGSTRLPALVGLGRAKELVLTGRSIDASEAERIGLVNRAVASGDLDRARAELVEELLSGRPVAVGRAKRVLDASARPARDTTLELEVAVQEYCLAYAREAGNS